MKIARIEAFQIQWSPDEKPSQRSAFVRVHTDTGLVGLGEASPMQGGRASSGDDHPRHRAPAGRPRPPSTTPCCSTRPCTPW